MVSIAPPSARRLRDAKARSIKRQQANPPQPLEGIVPDPVGQLRALLENGTPPADALALVRTSGLSSLVGGYVGPGATGLLQTALGLQLAGHPDALRSAIRVHPTEADLIAAAQARLANPETWLVPDAVAVACINEAERQRIATLLRPTISEAQGLAVRLYGADPVRFTKLILLASEIRPGDTYTEVFLSPGCRGLSAQELLPALRAARVGVHVLGPLFGGAEDQDGKPEP